MRDKSWNIVGAPTNDNAAEGIEMLPHALRSDELSDASFESNLPDDYQVLAEQLIADADHLAAQYPPSAPHPTNSTFANNRRLPWKSLAAAALLMATGAGLGVLWTKSNLAGHPASLDEHRTDLAKYSATEAGADLVAVDSKPARAGTPTANPAGIDEVGFSPVSTPRPPLDEVKLLQLQIDAFEQVIRKLQAELARKEQAHANTDAVIETLRGEISALRRELDEQSRPAK